MRIALALVVAFFAQDAKNAPNPKVDQARVDKAIDRGAEFLLADRSTPFTTDTGMRYDDIVLYTLYHAGVSPENEEFQRRFEKIMKGPLERTYCVAFQAMFLSEFDPAKYQSRIKQCCQFLVDNQCTNGQWSYGVEVRQEPDDVATGGKARSGPDVETQSTGAPAPRAKKKPLTPIQVQRRGKATVATGDDSNSQYGALGLRACMEANVWPPTETLKDAESWWEKNQCKDGGWGYYNKDEGSYGSMTMGGLGCLVIYKHFLRKNWQQDKDVLDAVNWTARKFSVTCNPNRTAATAKSWHIYYLYGLERAGILTGLDKFGSHDWYAEGANYLLDHQLENGTWAEDGVTPSTCAVRDTCFAILFLRRATVPLPKVATGQ